MKEVAVGVGHRCHPLSPFPVGRLVNDRRAILPQAFDLTIDVVGVKPEIHSADLVSLFRLRQPDRQVTESDNEKRRISFVREAVGTLESELVTKKAARRSMSGV